MVSVDSATIFRGCDIAATARGTFDLLFVVIVVAGCISHDQ